MPLKQADLSIGQAVFNLYSLRIGKIVEIRRISSRLGHYTSDVATVEVTERHNYILRIHQVRWRLDNCRRFSSKALRARQAFIQLARALEVSPLRLLPRRMLSTLGFNRARQAILIRRLRRHCRIKLSPRQLHPRQTSNQVIAAVLTAPLIRPIHRRRRR